MKDFPSCFSESRVQVADSSSGASRAAPDFVTCVYRTRLCGHSRLITVTWSKNLMGQGFSVAIDDSNNQRLRKVDIKPWLFSRRKGSKNVDVDGGRVDIYWDLSSAKFESGPEPMDGFYLAIVFNGKMVLLLGDLSKEAYKKTNSRSPSSDAVFISKRENISGKNLYCTKTQFCDNGQLHDVAIEHETVGVEDPCLSIRIDKKTVVQVKHLLWKFRGNRTILVDGLLIEVFWDVHNWLFSSTMANAVFMFQTCLPPEKLLSSGHPSELAVLPCPYSQAFGQTQLQGLGFSLILCAWKCE